VFLLEKKKQKKIIGKINLKVSFFFFCNLQIIFGINNINFIVLILYFCKLLK